MANVEGSIYRVENGVAVPYANLGGGGSLSSLSDVDLSFPYSGQYLEYDGNSGKWKNSETKRTISGMSYYTPVSFDETFPAVDGTSITWSVQRASVVTELDISIFQLVLECNKQWKHLANAYTNIRFDSELAGIYAPFFQPFDYYQSMCKVTAYDENGDFAPLTVEIGTNGTITIGGVKAFNGTASSLQRNITIQAIFINRRNM